MVKASRGTRVRNALTRVLSDRISSSDAIRHSVPGADLTATGTPPAETPAGEPALRFEILRPADLVAFTVLATACRVETREGAPVLVPEPGGNALLTIELGFQHVAELAVEEVGGGPAPVPPIPARAARKSRVVFKIPDGDSVVLSTQGILEAMGRLEMSVGRLAQPRKPPRMVSAPDEILAQIPGLFTMAQLPSGELVIAEPPRGSQLALSSTPDIFAAARTMREVRTRLTRVAALDLRANIGDRAGATYERPVFGPGGLVDVVPVFPPSRGTTAKPPTATDTAIEAPYRLVLSPSALNGWAHATMPVASPTDPSRIELWHSRLGVRQVDEESGAVTINEAAHPQRIVRAIWARDREFPQIPPPNTPFKQSLNPADRDMLVRQTSETPARTTIVPQPVTVRQFMLSSLGAWLDVFGVWDTKPYSAVGINTLGSWQHIAPMGRDQYVRKTYPGYLFPLGHQAELIVITERKIKSPTNPVAYMYQRRFIQVKEPLRNYTRRDMPFVEARIDPLATPDLLEPANQELFWPETPGGPYFWKVHTLDHEGRPVHVDMQMLFVAEALMSKASHPNIATVYAARSTVDGKGQSIAFAPPQKPGDTQNETVSLTFTGEAEKFTSTPKMVVANVVLPPMRHLGPGAAATNVEYAAPYLGSGFTGANAAGVYLALKTPLEMAFGDTQNSGGFVKPDISIQSLSRELGLGGDPLQLAGGTFNPATLLANSALLFGLFKLTDVLEAVGLDLSKAPKFICEALDKVTGLISDAEALLKAAQEAQAVVAQAKAAGEAVEAGLEAKLQQAKAKAETAVDDLKTGLSTLLSTVAGGATPAQVKNAVELPAKALEEVIAPLREVAASRYMSPLVKARLERLLNAIQEPLSDAVKLIDAVMSFVNGLKPGGEGMRARLEWRPVLKPLYLGGGNPVFEPKPDGLVLTVEVRAGGKSQASVDVLAELSDFKLNLFPSEPLVRIMFRRLSFRGGTSRKPEVDVVFDKLEFVGLLSFVEVLRSLIPLDGFSDPPFLEVTPAGVAAGFNVGLPNLAIGVFSLTNLSLGADTRIPFLGESVSVGFSFCTREKPFTLAVAFLGGGGFFGIRLSPKGLVLLEMALEFGAVLALDFGVASGSVSAMGGIYLRLEGDAGSLTGYFRVRGEVDVLSLISASIELYMALAYEFATGKMVGQARITVAVKVLVFSGSVQISCERRFAGSNGDPTVAEMLAYDSTTGNSDVWDTYCRAFAEE